MPKKQLQDRKSEERSFSSMDQIKKEFLPNASKDDLSTFLVDFEEIGSSEMADVLNTFLK